MAQITIFSVMIVQAMLPLFHPFFLYIHTDIHSKKNLNPWACFYVNWDDYTSMHLVLHAPFPSPCKAHTFVLVYIGNRIARGVFACM